MVVKQRARESNACTAVAHPHVEPSRISWNRVDLYNEVWNQPLVKLSRKYGISDVRLGKVCRKLKISHPGRGYWAKRKAGVPVERLPLPEFKNAPIVRRMKTKNADARLDKVSVCGQPDRLRAKRRLSRGDVPTTAFA